jgi:hypothetical protein
MIAKDVYGKFAAYFCDFIGAISLGTTGSQENLTIEDGDLPEVPSLHLHAQCSLNRTGCSTQNV